MRTFPPAVSHLAIGFDLAIGIVVGVVAFVAPLGADAQRTDKADGLRDLGAPAGEIEVPMDPQAGLPGALEYRRLDSADTPITPPAASAAAAAAAAGDDEEGGLVTESDLGDAEDADGEEVNDKPLPPYRGVRPGTRDRAAPYDDLLGKKHTYVTWIGYEPAVDRVFVQLSRPVEYTISKGEKGELVVDLHGARIGASNDKRPLDLAHFDTVVSRVWAKGIRGGDVRLFIELKEHTSYRLERKGRYIYVYFRG